jgi:hypothetical protein
MARTHGRFGVLYLGATNGGTATNIGFVSAFTVSAQTDFPDVTAMGDTGHVYVSGLPDTQGTFNGFWDAATATVFFVAARDGLSRKMYLYPAGSSANYWYGDVLLDCQFDSSVTDAIKVTSNWRASTAITPIGTI